ncbi:MAG: helix-turn-helix transcriptional regulator [Chloroflexota bacterium]|nr:helix-turn-helix transcriptional regulator [Chloroflexota bacterium]
MIFKKYILDLAKNNNLSLRAVARGIDISPSYLSEILNNKHPVNHGLLQKLAQFFDVSLVDMYTKAGWLSLDDEQEFYTRMQEILADEDDMKRFLDIMFKMKRKERQEKIKLILAAMGK